MRIDSIRIGAVNYQVIEAPSAELGDDNHLADVSHSFQRIRIQDGVPESRQAHLVVHEVLHALFDDSGLNPPRDEEERLVEALTPRVTAFLADNRGAIEALWTMLGVE